MPLPEGQVIGQQNIAMGQNVLFLENWAGLLTKALAGTGADGTCQGMGEVN
jgi:hypothetical protein